ncbi:DNA-binding Xre family transcriptional regulator [Peptoniphilus koenoeneniae]|uniref:DNA-binding Xre family transcriptional regulator n=1 Tax=Peptoniphilus koenoeneniae TaxID=507751 RepID=A0ABU0AV98_9FIRM|nr:helix-turn-helix transcriptional regulator [Peptoniphilus koenoeneniae]MDQ0274774.1 DNA-binding Xre family transcriptional regulator [Peptoniphilus koenoeneniae]
MSVCYKKLWKMLIDKEIAKKDLHNMTGVSNSTITKMSNNRYVSLEVLERICKSLECDLTDIVEINYQIEEEDHD